MRSKKKCQNVATDVPRQRKKLIKLTQHLDHALDEFVDELLTVAPVTTAGLVETVTLGLEATLGGGQLEGGQEIVGLLEVGSDGVDLVDEILHAGDAELAEGVVDLAVVIEEDALLVDAAVTTLVHELAHSVDGGVAVGDVGLDETQHHQSAAVDLDEDAVVHLAETEELHDLLGLRGDLVDTGKADGENKLGLGLDEEVTLLMGLAAKVNEVGLLTLVLLVVLGEVLLGELAKGLVLGLDLGASLSLLLQELGIAGSLLLLTLREDLTLNAEGRLDKKTVSHGVIPP